MIFDFVPENGEFQWLAVLKRKHKKPNSWSLSLKLLDRKIPPLFENEDVKKVLWVSMQQSYPYELSKNWKKKSPNSRSNFKLKKETSITLVLIGVKKKGNGWEYWKYELIVSNPRIYLFTFVKCVPSLRCFNHKELYLESPFIWTETIVHIVK